MVETANPERAKYRQLWNGAAYRIVSPGEQFARTFLDRAKPEQDAEVIDFGAGTGRGALALCRAGLRVTMVDFAENCLDPAVAEACEAHPTRLAFETHDLTLPLAYRAPFGFCCDVMEHIPTEDVQTVLRNILAAADRVFFNVSTVDDVMGATIGEKLHLTVRPAAWWAGQLEEAGAVVDWTMIPPGSCVFYCSGLPA